MNDGITHLANVPPQRPGLHDVVKTLTVNAILLQARQPGVGETGSSADDLCGLIKQHLPAESHTFSLLPVAPGGRGMDLDRYLLLWCCLSVGGCPSLPPHISSKPVKAIVQATREAGFAYSMRDVGKIERRRLVKRCDELARKNPVESTHRHLHEIILEGARDVFGRPAPHARLGAIMSRPDTSQEVAEPATSTSNHHIENFDFKVDGDTKGKGEQTNDDTEVERESTGVRQAHGNRKGPKQMLGAALSVDAEKSDGSEISLEEVRLVMASLTTSDKDKEGLFPTIKLVSPPSSHRTTSVLRPVATANPQPEEEEGPKTFSPLEYATNVGNAKVVHEIYLEARNTGTPRTPQQELARRHRACQMVLKEIKEVIQEVRWHRNGRGYQATPEPFVLDGIERVPTDEKREWLSEKRAILKGRQRECRTTICDNNEAADHLTVVIHALHVCKQAGEAGIVF